MKGRILAIDYGHARMGTALTDPMQIIAKPHSTLKSSKDPKRNAQMLAEEIKSIKPVKIIIGLPLHMDGKESDMSREVLVFIEHLKGLTTLPIETLDERLSSVQADRMLREAKLRRKERAKKIDKLSATVILQCYLDSFPS